MTTTSDILHGLNHINPNVLSFARHLRAANLSARTIKTYIEACDQFLAFLQAKGMPVELQDIHREHVEAFIEQQLELWKPATAANRFGGLRAFFKWAVEEGEIQTDRNPMARMRAPKVPETPVDVLNLEEVKKLLGAASGKSFEAKRDLAILRVFITTGARRGEVERMRYNGPDPDSNDVDLDFGVVRVLGKGNRQRLLPLDPKTVLAMDRYLRVRRKHVQANLPHLWLGKRGRFTADGMRQMLERHARTAGLAHIHLHQLRHSFAHHWLADGGTESDLMRIAGWKSSEMVRRYASSTAQERAIAASRHFGIGNQL